MAPFRDPTRTARESISDAAKLRDDRRDPSDPPPSNAEASKGNQRAPRLRHIIADAYAWGQRTSRAVAVLVGIAGAAATAGSAGFSYLIYHVWDDKRETEMAQLRGQMAIQRDDTAKILRSSERIEMTVSGIGPHLDRLDTKTDTQGNMLAGLIPWAKQRGYRP